MSSRFEPRPDERAHEVLPRVLPGGWWIANKRGDGYRYVYEGVATFMIVVASVSYERDRRRWIHVSVSAGSVRGDGRRNQHLPTYAQLCEVKDLFIGPGRKAVQVFPARAEHINIHPCVLHLFALVEGDPLPDFRRRDEEGRLTLL